MVFGNRLAVNQRHGVAALLLFVSAALAGCSEDEKEPLAEFDENIEAWALPLDQYFPNPVITEYALNALIHNCMSELGYTFHVVDSRVFIPPTSNRRLRSLFDEKIAAEYGYRAGKPEDIAAASAQQYPTGRTKAERRAIKDCSIDGGKELDSSNPLGELVQGLTISAYASAEDSPAMAEPARAWRECMEPLGIPDLPEVPTDGMPTDSQRVRFGTVRQQPTPRDRPSPITVAEIDEAVFDAKCRDSSQFTQTLYEEEVRLQLEAIDDNRDAIEDALEYTREVDAVAREAIESVGGSLDD